MNLKEQLYVYTLARCQTISRASEELYISPPALSIYISNLEKYLGVKLFERTGKSFVLTPIGEEYVKRAEKMLDMKQEFDRLVEQESGRRKGRIRLGIQQRRAITVAPYIMSCISKEFPDIDLVIKEGNHKELVKMYQDRGVDLLVCIYRDELPDAEYIEIGKERVLIALPSSHPANQNAYGSPKHLFRHLDLTCLDRETFILPVDGQSLRMTADRIFEQFQIKPGRIIEISNFETIMSMVDKDLGVAFNRLGYVAQMKRYPGIHYYFIGNDPFYSRVVIAYHRDLILTDPIKRLITLLKDCSRYED